MKTLIINGSPRKNGDTTALIDEFTKYLNEIYECTPPLRCSGIFA